MSKCHPVTQDVSYLPVGCAEKFNYKSHNTISSEKPDSELSWIADMLLLPEKDEEKNDTFE